MFDSVDGNGDGVLSLPELHTFLVGPQVSLKSKDCEDLFRILDANTDGSISKFEFVKGFEVFRAGVMTLKESEAERDKDKLLAKERLMQGAKSPPASVRHTPRKQATAPASEKLVIAGSTTNSRPVGGQRSCQGSRRSPTTGVVLPPIHLKMGSPPGLPPEPSPAAREVLPLTTTHVRASRAPRGSFVQSLITRVSNGSRKVINFIGAFDGHDKPRVSVSGPSRLESSRPGSRKKSRSPSQSKKWFGQSFLEMFGLKSRCRVSPALPPMVGVGNNGSGPAAETHEEKASTEALDEVPESIWVRGVKADGFRVQVVKSSTLKKLMGLFNDMDTDRDGHIDLEEFNSSFSSKGSLASPFRRDVFDRISVNGLCTFKNMLRVLYPGATAVQVETMLAMSKLSGASLRAGGGNNLPLHKKGPTHEQIDTAAHLFAGYDKTNHDVLTEEEFSRGISSNGVYTLEDARKEFNRMDLDDSRTISREEFTLWYSNMDEIGKRVRRNA
uniref:EF-hand domain-containing protein n=1 Tax=Mantoniella antarctica TaxID=81844 RepID=A0A7S0SSB0_9CHLO